MPHEACEVHNYNNERLSVKVSLAGNWLIHCLAIIDITFTASDKRGSESGKSALRCTVDASYAIYLWWCFYCYNLSLLIDLIFLTPFHSASLGVWYMSIFELKSNESCRSCLLYKNTAATSAWELIARPFTYVSTQLHRYSLKAL